MIIRRKLISAVVQQYIREAVSLRNIRLSLARAPHVRLNQLRRLDDRLAAHLDGLNVAGEYGSELVVNTLESVRRGEIFTAAVQFIETRDWSALEKTFAFAQVLPGSQAGLISAFGWVSATSLRGITQSLLNSEDPFRRQVGIVACRMHGVDPGEALVAALSDADPALRACALRTAADVGRVELRAVCGEALADADPRCAFEAARAVALLGNRQAALPALGKFATCRPKLDRRDLCFRSVRNPGSGADLTDEGPV